MKHKVYEKPAMQVVEVRHEHLLQEGSEQPSKKKKATMDLTYEEEEW